MCFPAGLPQRAAIGQDGLKLEKGGQQQIESKAYSKMDEDRVYCYTFVFLFCLVFYFISPEIRDRGGVGVTKSNRESLHPTCTNPDPFLFPPNT
jgi:hypothetical protein